MEKDRKNLSSIADDIYHHQTSGKEMDKVTARYPALTVNDAYEIQEINVIRAIETGDQFAGWKMGLTSTAKQQSVGVHQPIYGRLLKSMEMSKGQLSLEGLIHPRVEPEFAFFITKKLEGQDITAQDVWDSTESIMLTVEVIDSRYQDFSFNLIDVVADNTSCAKFFIHEQRYSPNRFEWENIKVQVKQNGKVAHEGKGSDVLGHPVHSVVELVKMLHSSGLCIEPGMIVLTGGITEALRVQKGDSIEFDFNQLGSIDFTVI